MKGLAKFLVETILGEADQMDKVVVVYSGRFQPFHKGHYAAYDHLVKKFGKDTVYIGTSDVTDSRKSPFGFKEKKAIMQKMFGIPSNKIVQIKNPYAPQEILSKYDSDTTGFITVVGEKDASRLSGKYFTPYKGKVDTGYLDKGYVYAAPAQSNPISGTDVRYWLSSGSEAERKKNFTKAYPKFDDQIFKMITLKLKKLKECINEEIKMNVKVGDEILMGKFKNKKVVVKSIGKDEWGMPTINGKKAVTFRIPKKDLKENFAGGAGVGLSLPGGYINGAPNPKDVKKLKSKLDKDGSEEYQPVKEDQIPGGLAKGMTLADIAKHHKVSPQTLKNEFIKGYTVEREHTTDVNIAKEIALDHLYEDPNYYSKLSKIETPFNEAGFPMGYMVAAATANKNLKKRKELELEKLKLTNQAFKLMPNSPAQLKVRAEIDKINKEIDKLKIGESTSSEIIKDLDKVKNDLLKKVDVLVAKKKKLYSNVDIESPMSADEKKLDKDIADLFSQINKLVLQKRSLKEGLLTEGGAYGHMNHPFDIQMNLTFGDLKQIVVRALNGDLELAREKTDGQALAISWVNGRLVAARNKSHTKNQGEGAMTIGQVASQFAGRGELTNAYTFAMNDLSKAIAGLTEPQRKKIFKDGKCFMNLEVIYPKNSNVIPYGQNILVFHGTFEYNKEGEVIGENQQAAKILAGMIKQVNKHVQDTYTIQGPPIQSLPKSEKLSKLQGKYIGMINKLQKEFGLSDSDGVADYHQAWWTNFVEKGAKSLEVQEKIGLVKRWAFGDKGFRITQIQDPKIRAWADKTDKQDQQKIMKDNLMKFEEIFLGVGADVLSFMESVLTANPSDATKQLRKELGNAIKQIKASGNPQKIEKLKIELSRLNAIGGFDKIVPNEGIVFTYGGNTYKLTGAFAPLNQILGIFKYGR